jgi:hypothetical protein
MDYWVAFLGAPKAIELRTFADPPGHPACLRASVRLCPHIALQRHRRTSHRPSGADAITPPGFRDTKPDVWSLAITRAYRLVRMPDTGIVVYHAQPFRTIERYGYAPDGTITPIP